METEHLGAQDTYYVGNIMGVGHIYQQASIGTYSKVAFCKLCDCKNALAARFRRSAERPRICAESGIAPAHLPDGQDGLSQAEPNTKTNAACGPAFYFSVVCFIVLFVRRPLVW